MNTMLKAALKAGLEAVRTMTLPFSTYITVQAEILLLKNVGANLLRDCSDSATLVDQILSIIFSRYVGANDISNASDGNETSLVNRAVGEALGVLAQSAVLIH